MVDILDNIELVDYDEEDPEEDPEEEPEEDVDIDLEDNVELIFPYELEGDKTPPPGDVLSDYVSSDSESEDEEADVPPEAIGGTITATFRGRDLEASRARARVMEAELGTWQTEIAHLKSKDKIREREMELLNHDLENVEHALGNVLERVSVLESRENATLKKRLAETETKLVWAYMERDTAERRIMPPKAMSEARMREVIREQVIVSMAEFVANMNSGAGGTGVGGAGAGGAGASGAGVGGAGIGGARASGGGANGARVVGARPASSEFIGCTYITFMKCVLHPFKGTESAVRLCRAMTWWNGRIASMGIYVANGTSWTEVRKWMTDELCPRSLLQRLEQELYNLKLKWIDIDGYTNQFHELALLCPRMVEPEKVKVEQYIRGLSKNIHGDVTSSRPAGIDEAVRMAYQLIGQIIQDKTDEVFEGEKWKGKGDRGRRGDNRRDYNHRQNQRRANAGAMTNVAPNDNEVCPKCKNKKHGGDCWKCGKCSKLGHKTAACWSLDKKDVTCFNCNEKGHQKRDYP
uniref:Ty3 transposon capsid-like protein domain-containing protein n=1 Tax=Tanacetum cinerariifolium TaxID=118510 RepID=A0A699JCL1_TANCI|nr:hypothetical protein [Tanacetum cinerariifolium]